MKNLKLLATALVASAISLPALADINISGDGRYRFGTKDNGTATDNYRNGRMRFTISGGNDTAGVSMRIRSDVSGSAVANLTDASVRADGDNAAPVENGGLRNDKLTAFVNLGAVRVDMGELSNYTGLLSFYPDGSEFSSRKSIQISGGTDMFSAFIRSDQGSGATEKPDFLMYGLDVSVAGLNIGFTSRPDSYSTGSAASADQEVAGFTDIVISGSVGGANFDVEQFSSDATTDSDMRLVRVALPVAGLNVKAGYASFNPGFTNHDGAAILGTGIFNWSYKTVNLTGNSASTEDTTYTGIAVGGSAGSVNYQVAVGSFDDAVNTTGNSFYDVTASYALDSSTTLRAGLGRANDEEGLGFEVHYKF